jgi:hypothetical protein
MSNTSVPSLSMSSRIVAAVEHGMTFMPRVRWTRGGQTLVGIALAVFYCPARGQCVHVQWSGGVRSDVPVSELELSA